MSGYWTMRYHLAQLGERDGFFGRIIGSGGHVNSLRMLLDGEIDTAAIDSMVMAPELEENPGLAAKIRVVEVLGPTPIPPWVIRKGVPAAVRAQVRRALTTMHEDEAGREVLAACGMRGFAAVQDGHYDRVREMIAKAAEVGWGK
jgi:phosphonate transport system substrate-binding protein